jgi:predicted transcriptional regulator
VLYKLMGQVADFECSISISVDKLIDALVKSEIDALVKASKKYTMADEGTNMPEAMILEGLQEYSWEIKYDVKKQLKEKFKGLTVDEVIKKVKVETQSSYKAVAKKYCAEALDRVLS